jgi:hypothetical protein
MEPTEHGRRKRKAKPQSVHRLAPDFARTKIVAPGILAPAYGAGQDHMQSC